jgi:hypothetical protein
VSSISFIKMFTPFDGLRVTQIVLHPSTSSG